MKKNSLCVAAVLFGLVHASIIVAEGALQLAAEQSARPLSAFFGLDNKLPFGANVLCLGAPKHRTLAPKGSLLSNPKKAESGRADCSAASCRAPSATIMDA